MGALAVGNGQFAFNVEFPEVWIVHCERLNPLP
jgi:hypothetical protein